MMINTTSIIHYNIILLILVNSSEVYRFQPVTPRPMVFMSPLINFPENSIQVLPALVVVTAFPLRFPANKFNNDLYLLTLIGLFPKHTVPCKTTTIYTTAYDIQCCRRHGANNGAGI